MRQSLTKIYKWEFWPFWFFYIPVYFYWLYLSLRAKSFFFFSAANPLMELGGFSNYSKYNVLKNIPPQYIPKTILISTYQEKRNIEAILAENQLSFPLIAKPDRGERGKGVTKVKNLEELKTYLFEAGKEVILQEFIEYPLEFGVMYYRLPNEKRGQVSSIVQKEFLSVVGDGNSTVQELVIKNQRSHLFLKHLQEKYPEVLHTVPAKDEKLILEPIGNHSRGTIFLNATHLVNEELIDVFDQISQQIKGFYFGRYDLKVKSLEDLYTGENIKIMELNGANSEPAHIYDPHMPILQAYRFLFSHWSNLYQISVKNHQNGINYIGQRYAFTQVLKQLKGN
ncbi:MAG: hypothetical protein NW226_16750 [Microscillaceae bacterium]|nr:hypothetical protein [Microscillaceae bacterium]